MNGSGEKPSSQGQGAGGPWDELLEKQEERSRMTEDERMTQLEQGGDRHRVFQILPREAGESSKEYGERVSDGYNLKVVAQHIKRNIDRKVPETNQHHIERVRAFMNAHPRQEGQTLEEYERYIDGLFESGAVDSNWGLDPNATDPNSQAPIPPADEHTEQPAPDSPESKSELGEFIGEFQIDEHSGITLEKQFKQLTGEDWSDADYYAEWDGVDDDSYDYPLLTVRVWRRAPKTSTTSEGDNNEGGEGNGDNGEEGIGEGDGNGEDNDNEHPQHKPLVGINADFSFDRKDLARHYAQEELNAELQSSGFLKRIWKGNLFAKYYQHKYERQILEGKDFTVGDRRTTLGEIIGDSESGSAKSAIERFVLSVSDEYSGNLVHSLAGEKLTEADERTTRVVREAIERFATAEIPEGHNLEDAKRDFLNDLRLQLAEGRDNNQPLNESMVNNFYEVAVQARERAAHEEGIEQIMEGFKIYNADARNNIRNQEHRDGIDRIVDKIESSTIGQFIPAEVLAGAVSAAFSLSRTGARAAAGTGGGIIASGVIQMLRERNRLIEERNHMMRAAASGLRYEGKRASDKKRGEHEFRIGGTLYDYESAKTLTENLETALEHSAEDNGESLLEAIAEASVRIEYSDSEQKDLIGYSSPDKIGDERLALDLALIKAQKELTEEQKAIVENMRGVIREGIINDNEEKDDKFDVEKLKISLSQGAKTIAAGALSYFFSQEILGAINPAKISVGEKLGIIKTTNNADARETFGASLVGQRGMVTSTKTVSGITGDPNTIQRYQNAGYTPVVTQPEYTTTSQVLTQVSPNQSANAVNVIYDGWANNGTSLSDYNELRVYLNNGQFSSGMLDASTMGGQAFDYAQLANDGRIKGFLTIDGSKFEIASSIGPSGELTWGDNGVFTTTAGDVISGVIGPNGERNYEFFEVAVDNGIDANGLQHIIPLATDPQRNVFNGTMQSVVDVIEEHPAIYDFVKEIQTPREVDYFGVPITLVPRTSIGVGRSPIPRPVEEPEPTEPTGQEDDGGNTPNPEPEPIEQGTQGDNGFENAQEAIKNEIRAEIPNVNDEDLGFLMNNEHYNPADKERYDQWYDSLDGRGVRTPILWYIGRHPDRSTALREYFTQRIEG